MQQHNMHKFYTWKLANLSIRCCLDGGKARSWKKLAAQREPDRGGERYQALGRNLLSLRMTRFCPDWAMTKSPFW
jgi:hypothetical protein